jgi:hypothetical protein
MATPVCLMSGSPEDRAANAGVASVAGDHEIDVVDPMILTVLSPRDRGLARIIGAIVAEFFGTPTQGIGFRISTEAGRMAIDMVWAEIALAALAGMAFYGCVTLAERATTFWHPSYRT